MLNETSVCATTAQDKFNNFYKTQKERIGFDGASVFEKRLNMGLRYEKHIEKTLEKGLKPLGYHEFVNLNIQERKIIGALAT